MPAAPFDAGHPYETSNFALPVAVYDAAGTRADLVIYFRKEAARDWDYRVLVGAGASGVELSAGTLSFNRAGGLERWVEKQPLRVPFTPGAPPTPIALDFGPTGGTAPATISVPLAFMALRLAVDGAGGRVGSACEARDQPRPRPPRGSAVPTERRESPADLALVSVCEARATSRAYFQGNLFSDAPVQERAWNSGDPNSTSDFMVPTGFTNRLGWPATVRVYFRHARPQHWEYHALVVAEGPSIEVGWGTLVFDGGGRLARHEVQVPVRLPEVTDGPEPEITLDFGSTAATGDFSWTGVTQLPTATYLQDVLQDGTPAELAKDCPALSPRSLEWLQDPAPAEAPRRTDKIQLLGNFDQSAAIATVPWDATRPLETSTMNVNTVATDALGDPLVLTAFFRREAQSTWAMHIMLERDSGWSELGSTVLSFLPIEQYMNWSFATLPTLTRIDLPFGANGAAVPVFIDYVTGVGEIHGFSWSGGRVSFHANGRPRGTASPTP